MRSYAGAPRPAPRSVGPHDGSAFPAVSFPKTAGNPRARLARYIRKAVGDAYELIISTALQVRTAGALETDAGGDRCAARRMPARRGDQVDGLATTVHQRSAQGGGGVSLQASARILGRGPGFPPTRARARDAAAGAG